jgi:acyl-CoA thioesterase
VQSADLSAPDGPASAETMERRRIAADVAAEDHAVHALGAEVTAVGEGRAVVQIVLGRDHTNGLGLAHGGVVFFLADTAMAYASIRMGGGAAVTTSADVLFCEPAALGRLQRDEKP